MKNLIQIGFILGFASLAFAGPKLSKDLPPATSTAPVNVVVQFKTPPTKDELQQLGPYGQLKKVFNSINAANLIVSPSFLSALEADPNVKYVSPNRAHKGFLDLTTAAVSAGVAWQSGWNGTGVGIAIIDSGILLKHDLTGPDGVSSRVVYSENFGSTPPMGTGTGLTWQASPAPVERTPAASASSAPSRAWPQTST